jgi:predicted amidohydrolase
MVTNANDMIEDTLNEYLRLIDEASNHKVDILIFPEGCLNYIGIGTRKLLIKYAVELNDEDIYNSTNFNNSCDYSKKSKVSC